MISRLRDNFAIISEWFYENFIVDADKCYFLTVGFNDSFLDFSFDDTTIENFTEKKITGIVIDNKLNFKSHLKNVC